MTTPSGIYQEAVEEAKKITMMPGASEHQLGLAVDLLDRERSRYVYEDMDQDFLHGLTSIAGNTAS